MWTSKKPPQNDDFYRFLFRAILFTVLLSWGVGIWRWYYLPVSFAQVGLWADWWIYLPILLVLLTRSSQTKQRQEAI